MKIFISRIYKESDRIVLPTKIGKSIVRQKDIPSFVRNISELGTRVIDQKLVGLITKEDKILIFN